MIITATDFQLRVNEYFTKIMQGEEVIIERYGKKFSVLIPFGEYEEFIEYKSNKLSKQAEQAEIESASVVQKPVAVPVVTGDIQSEAGSEENLEAKEVLMLVKRLLK